MYNRDNRGEHSLIKDSLNAATVILPKGKEHRQQVACSAPVIQANARARERVTASFFSYERSCLQTRSHTLRPVPQIYWQNGFPQHFPFLSK